MLIASFRLSHTLHWSLPIVILQSIPASRLRVSVIVEPSYANLLTDSGIWSSMEISGVLSQPWPRTCVFFRLIGQKQCKLLKTCQSCLVNGFHHGHRVLHHPWRTVNLWKLSILFLTLILERLNRLQSEWVWRNRSLLSVWKACLSTTENVLNKV